MSTLHDQLEAAIKERLAVPAEVYEAAAVAIHDRECADGSMCTATPTSMKRYAELAKVAVDAVWPFLVVAGRASIHTEWAASLAQDAQADDIEALRARVRQQLDDAEARGYARAVAALRDETRWLAFISSPDNDQALYGEDNILAAEYLEAVGGEITPPPTEAEIRARVAQEIRTHLILSSCGGPCFQDRCDCRARDVVEQAAKIAECGAQTPGGSE